MGEKENVSSDEDKFFEGVEKLLEVWFTTQSGNTDHCDLRQIPRWVIQFDSGRKLITQNGNYLSIFIPQYKLFNFATISKFDFFIFSRIIAVIKTNIKTNKIIHTRRFRE